MIARLGPGLALVLAACASTRAELAPVAPGSAADPAQGGIAIDAPGLVGPASASASGAEAQDARDGYTCPMHPDVHAQEPGTCPSCGAKLVPR